MVVVGVLLPYLVRVPCEARIVMQYFPPDHLIGSQMFFGVFNAIAWGTVLLASFLYKHALSVFVPAVCGFSVLALGRFSVDLASSSTASIALIFIPIFAAEAALIGGFGALFVDGLLERKRFGIAIGLGLCCLLVVWSVLWLQGNVRWPLDISCPKGYRYRPLN